VRATRYLLYGLIALLLLLLGLSLALASRLVRGSQPPFPVADGAGDAAMPIATTVPVLDEAPRAADGTPLALQTATFALG
jgi:hypothetical protein